VRSGFSRYGLRRVPCGWCGKLVRETRSGRGRRWCSDACRMRSIGRTSERDIGSRFQPSGWTCMTEEAGRL
jgi:endogenous inhibitor of DNA gyrase (YacG/DUF329 family)